MRLVVEFSLNTKGFPIIPKVEKIIKCDSNWLLAYFSPLSKGILLKLYEIEKSNKRGLYIVESYGNIPIRINGVAWSIWKDSREARAKMKYWQITGSIPRPDGEVGRINVVNKVVPLTTRNIPDRPATEGRAWNIDNFIITRAEPAIPTLCGGNFRESR